MKVMPVDMGFQMVYYIYICKNFDPEKWTKN